MKYPYNLAIIASEEDWAVLQAWLASIGWPNEIGMALSKDGATETHRAIHPRADQSIVDIANGASLQKWTASTRLFLRPLLGGCW